MLLAMPIAGSVGSLFGLNPYSSTSFLRSSSASFRCVRFRQKKRATRTIKATATRGTTTATAIFPPGESPSEFFSELTPDVAKAAGSAEVLDDDGRRAEVCGLVVVGAAVSEAVRVMTMERIESPPLGVITTIISSAGGAGDDSIGLDEVSGMLGGGGGGVEGIGADELGSSGVDGASKSEVLGRGVSEGNKKDVEVKVKIGIDTGFCKRSQSLVSTRSVTCRVGHHDDPSVEGQHHLIRSARSS